MTIYPEVLRFLVVAGEAQLQKNRARWLRWAEANREKLKATTTAWREQNRERINADSREWAKANPEKRRAVNQAWRANNRERKQQIAREYQRRRYADPSERLRILARNRVYAAIRRGKGEKSAKTTELIGCSVAELRVHLEQQFQPGMSWANLGPVWHIDHCRPCAIFDMTDPAQQRACFHFSNLQPLFAFENMSKGARVDGQCAA